MLNVLFLAVLALAASSVSALAVPRAPDASNWSDTLEDYSDYHRFYLSIGCQNKHSDIAFFNKCCHPLLKGAEHDPSCDSSTRTVSSNSGFVTNGFATFFYQNGNAGACGQYHSDHDLIAAMDVERYGDTSRKSSLCGKRVEIINPKNRKSVTVTVADACPTCTNENSIDLSYGAFTKIATESEGMVPILWKYV